MNKIGITTDCACDLPEKYLKANGIDFMYFYIITATGKFRDGYEITSENVLEYMENGGQKTETVAPVPEEYKEFFENALKRYDELVHISVGSQVNLSSQNAIAALELMGENGKKVRVIDSKHLSTGVGHMVIRAAKLRDMGKSADEIAGEVESMKSKISTTFIAKNADYLYQNGKVGKFVKNVVTYFTLHPVLTLNENKIVLKTLKIGNYEKAMMRYIRGQLRREGSIDKKQLFITHAGCTVKTIAKVRAEVEKYCKFDEVTVTKASATSSGDGGPETLGVFFVYN